MDIKNLFRSKSTPVAAPKEEKDPLAIVRSRSLLEAVAVSDLLEMLSRVPEVDEILLKAGITRSALMRLETDDEIYAALRTRRESILATKWRIENANEKELEFLLNELKPRFAEIVTGAWQAVPYGYSVLERVYKKNVDGTIGLASALLKPMEWFDPQRDGTLKYFPSSGASSEGILVDQDFKFLMTRQDPTYKRPMGDALMSKLYWPWIFRHNTWQFWAQFLERYGAPVLVGKSTDTVKMAAALATAAQGAAIAIGKEDDVDALDPNNNGEAFQTVEAVIVKRYQKLILGQTLTSDTGGTDGKGNGTFALGKVHAKVAETLTIADIRLVTEPLQNVVSALVRLNKLNPKITFMFSDEDNLASTRADRDKVLYDQGVRFKKNYFMDTYHLEEGDFDITDQQADAAGIVKQDPATRQSGKSKAQKQDEADTKRLTAAQLGFVKSVQEFTKNQQALEDAIKMSMEEIQAPISAEEILKIAKTCKNPAELETALSKLMDTTKLDQFTKLLEQGLFYADVVGYVDAEENMQTTE